MTQRKKLAPVKIRRILILSLFEGRALTHLSRHQQKSAIARVNKEENVEKCVGNQS